MLRWVILSVVVIVLAAVATFAIQYGTTSSPSWDLPARAKASGPQPKVEVEGALTHDFGTMPVQKSGSHTWVVRNTGEGELQLWMANSTCKCTVAKLKDGQKATLKPGESTEIALEWKTKEVVGQYSQGATIGTSDLTRPEFKLAIKGTVHNPIVILPELSEGVLSIGTISTDEPKIVSFAIFSPERPDMKLTKISTSKPDILSVKQTTMTPNDLKRLKGAKGGRLVDIEIKPGMSLGDFRDEINVETDHPDQPRLNITLAGTATGPISLMPNRLRGVVVNGKEGGTQQITMIVRGGGETKFKVAHQPENVEVSVASNETPTQKGRYRLTVKVPPGTPAGLIDDQIILNTSHPKVSELKIPINIVIGAG
jgi:hypothetical protein